MGPGGPAGAKLQVRWAPPTSPRAWAHETTFCVRTKLGSCFLEPGWPPLPHLLTFPVGQHLLALETEHSQGSGWSAVAMGHWHSEAELGSPCSHGGPATCLPVHVPADPGAPVGALMQLLTMGAGPRSPCIFLGYPGLDCGAGFDGNQTPTVRGGKVLGRRCCACNEGCGIGSDITGPKTQASGALRPPGVEDSPPPLNLVLLALNADLGRLSPQDIVLPLGEAQKSQPPDESATSGAGGNHSAGDK